MILRLIKLQIALLLLSFVTGCFMGNGVYLLRPRGGAKLSIHNYKGNKYQKFECELLPKDIDYINSILSKHQLKWKMNFASWAPEYVIRTKQYTTKLLIQGSTLNFEEGGKTSVYCRNPEVSTMIKNFLNKIHKKRKYVIHDYSKYDF